MHTVLAKIQYACKNSSLVNLVCFQFKSINHVRMSGYCLKRSKITLPKSFIVLVPDDGCSCCGRWKVDRRPEMEDTLNFVVAVDSRTSK